MPVDFLTSEQKASYGQFPGEPNEVQLTRYFHLDETDLAFILQRRGDQNRFGVALQLGCVRFLGTFLNDLSRVPANVQWFVARQLGITDLAILSPCAQRETTRREHTARIRTHYQYREFTWPWSFRLTRLLYTRSWISNERPSPVCYSDNDRDINAAINIRQQGIIKLRAEGLPVPANGGLRKSGHVPAAA